MTVPRLIETKGECPTCKLPLEKQLLRSMDGTKSFASQGTQPPPAAFSVGVFPYKCPKCPYTEFEQVGREIQWA
jgi:hypothetical protein